MDEQINNGKINKLKIEIFDIIRQEEPLVMQKNQIIQTANSRINDIDNEINRLESMKSPKVQELIELEKEYNEVKKFFPQQQQ